MIKANELRIGNKICRLNQTNILTVYSISKDGDIQFDELPDNPFDISEEERQGFDGVKLTPEILEAAGGLGKCNLVQAGSNYSTDVTYWPMGSDSSILGEGEEIKYLHELQNYYFAIYREELEINLHAIV